MIKYSQINLVIIKQVAYAKETPLKWNGCERNSTCLLKDRDCLLEKRQAFMWCLDSVLTSDYAESTEKAYDLNQFTNAFSSGLQLIQH